MQGTRPRRLSLFAIAILCFPIACTDSTAPGGLGRVSAKVVDANNVGVQGVAADLYKLVQGGALLWRASLTSSDGVAVFGASDGGVTPGSYYIHLSFVTNYQLAPGESNDRPVNVLEGEDIVVTFHTVSSGPSH